MASGNAFIICNGSSMEKARCKPRFMSSSCLASNGSSEEEIIQPGLGRPSHWLASLLRSSLFNFIRCADKSLGGNLKRLRKPLLEKRGWKVYEIARIMVHRREIIRIRWAGLSSQVPHSSDRETRPCILCRRAGRFWFLLSSGRHQPHGCVCRVSPFSSLLAPDWPTWVS
jgi:hypothetical protein